MGSILGLGPRWTGGWLDQLLSRFVDALMSIPALIFSLLLLTIFGTSVLTLILVIAAVDATRVFRLARAVAQGIVVMDYIEAAKLRGEGAWFLIRREILPKRHGAAGGRVRPALLLRLPDDFLAQLPRAGHQAAHRRLGQHGARTTPR